MSRIKGQYRRSTLRSAPQNANELMSARSTQQHKLTDVRCAQLCIMVVSARPTHQLMSSDMMAVNTAKYAKGLMSMSRLPLMSSGVRAVHLASGLRSTLKCLLLIPSVLRAGSDVSGMKSSTRAPCKRQAAQGQLGRRNDPSPDKSELCMQRARRNRQRCRTSSSSAPQLRSAMRGG